MYCGMVLSSDTEEACALAGIDEDGVETVSLSEDDAIIDWLQERHPLVVAVNAPPDRDTSTGFRPGEEELIEEGHSMLPQEMRDNTVLERAAYLAQRIRSSGIGCDVIESDPGIVMQEMDISTDADLEDMGLETRTIHSVHEFEAVVLAVIAQLYDAGDTADKDIFVPDTGND